MIVLALALAVAVIVWPRQAPPGDRLAADVLAVRDDAAAPRAVLPEVRAGVMTPCSRRACSPLVARRNGAASSPATRVRVALGSQGSTPTIRVKHGRVRLSAVPELAAQPPDRRRPPAAGAGRADEDGAGAGLPAALLVGHARAPRARGGDRLRRLLLVRPAAASSTPTRCSSCCARTATAACPATRSSSPTPPTTPAAREAWEKQYGDANGILEQVYLTGTYFGFSPFDYERQTFPIVEVAAGQGGRRRSASSATPLGGGPGARRRRASAGRCRASSSRASTRSTPTPTRTRSSRSTR